MRELLIQNTLLVRIFRSMTVLLLAILVVIAPLSVSAQSEEQAPGSGLQISPTRHELTVGQGNESSFKITLKNVSNGNVIAKAAVNDFESDNLTGEPKINPDTTNRSDRSIFPFLFDVTDVPLSKDETKEVTVGIDVPPDTSPGGYYGIVRYQAVPVDGTDGQVLLSASLGTIVLLTVPGEQTESLRIDTIAVKRNGQAGGIFFGSGPRTAALQTKNTGTSFLQPFGKVSITKGKKEVFSYEMNNTTPRGNVLPNSVRVFENGIEKVSSFGKYTITANIGFGTNSEVVTVSKSFWVIPWWIVVVFMALVLLIVGALLVLRWRLGKRHRTL